MNDNLVEISNLTKKYGSDSIALDNVSLTIKRGKIIGLLGPNGAGKTTLIKILVGLIKNYKGNIKINGNDIGVETKKIVSYLPDVEFINGSWKISYALEYYSVFFEDFDIEKAKNLLNKMNIDINKTFKTLSKGNKEKVQLILALSRNAKLYIFDEPIAGVDPAARDLIFSLILENYNKDATIIISTHLISDAEKILDEYIFLKKGKVVQSGEVESVRKDKNMTLDEIFREEFRCLADF